MKQYLKKLVFVHKYIQIKHIYNNQHSKFNKTLMNQVSKTVKHACDKIEYF
jgi:hypothetical protein